MTLNPSHFKISDSSLNLTDFDTAQKGGLEKEESRQILADLKEELYALQEKLYASDSKSLLIIFQAMDAGGKDSIIKHVMSGLNPQGVQVYSFKQPSKEELDHDFLWRHYKALPERGRIGIHNRSHYENVLICKVHPQLAAAESGVPVEQLNKSFWKSRYQSILNFEDHLINSGTVILKFFLHISKEEQKKRFLERIDDPSKNWKFSAADINEREKWGNYMQAYEDAIKATATEQSPWYVIPADKKWFAHVNVCQVITDTLKAMDLDFPKLNEEELDALSESKIRLINESG